MDKTKIKRAFKGIDRKQLAKDIKSTTRTVDQIACGLLLVSPKRAVAIERFTNGKVKAQLLRPDIFFRCDSFYTKKIWQKN